LAALAAFPAWAAGAALAALAAFPTWAAGAAVKNPDTYVYVTISDLDSLDPAWAYDTASQLVIYNVYEFLVGYDGSSTERLVPQIATQVPSRENGLLSADGLTYTFPIRKGVRFHDGSELTPEDVRYSIMRFCLMDRDGGPSSLLLEPLVGYPSTRDEKGNLRESAYDDLAKAVRVEGDKVILSLPKPFAPVLNLLAGWAPVVSRKWVTQRGGWDGSRQTWMKFNNPAGKEASPLHDQVNGTGPFTLERWDKGTKEVLLVRNDAYWRQPARLKRVRIKGVNEFSTRKLMLEAGDADSISVDWPVYSQLQNLPGIRLLENLPTVEMNPVLFFTFQINPVGNPDIGSGKLDGQGISPDFFQDLDVRKGFAYAFDYEALLRDAYRGKATQATGCIPKSLPGHNPKQPVYQHDPQKAQEHLRKAWKGQVWGKGFKFTLSYNEGNTIRQILCTILKRNVEALNPKFKIDVRPMQWSTFLERQTAHKLPLFTLGWNADYPDPHNFAFPFLHSKGIYPQAQRWQSPEADKLIELGMAETNLAKRKKIYAELQALEYRQVPHLVFVDTTRYRAERTWVRGFFHNPIFPDSPYAGYFYSIWKEEDAGGKGLRD